MTILATLGLFALQAAMPPVLADDSRLKAPISIQARLKPLGDLCRELSRSSGVSIRPLQTLAEIKLALRIVDRPAGWVLDQAADVLDLEWRKAGDGYELFQPPDAAKAISETIRAERARRWDRQRQWLGGLAKLSERSRADLKAEADDVNRQIDEIETSALPGIGVTRLFELQRKSQELQGVLDLASYALGRFMQGHQLQVESMVRGSAVEAAATGSIPGFRALSWPSEERASAQFFFFGANLRSRLRYAAFESGQDGVNLSVREEPQENEAEPPSPAMRFIHWGHSHAQIAAGLAGRKLAEPKLKSWPEHPIFADILLEAAEQSGLDLVADAFHEPVKNALPSGGSPAQIWQSISRTSFGPFVRVADGAVMVRHSRFWNLRESEIPEPVLGALNAADAKDRGTLYRAAAEFASALTAEQERRLGDLRYEGWGRNVEFARYALPAFKFWAVLSPAERESALARQPLPMSSLSPAAAAAYRRAVLEYVLLGGGGSPETAARLLTASLAGQTEGLSFLTESSTGPYVSVTTGTRNFILPLANAPEGSEAEGMKTDHYFYFGYDATHAIRFTTHSLVPKNK